MTHPKHPTGSLRSEHTLKHARTQKLTSKTSQKSTGLSSSASYLPSSLTNPTFNRNLSASSDDIFPVNNLTSNAPLLLAKVDAEINPHSSRGMTQLLRSLTDVGIATVLLRPLARLLGGWDVDEGDSIGTRDEVVNVTSPVDESRTRFVDGAGIERMVLISCGALQVGFNHGMIMDGILRTHDNAGLHRGFPSAPVHSFCPAPHRPPTFIIWYIG
jgi:hypothetical protein